MSAVRRVVSSIESFLSNIKARAFQVEEQWRKPPLGYCLLAVGVCFIGYWFFRIPPSNYSLIAMAVAAGLMALRPEMSGRERSLWAVILILFAVVEIRAIRKDKADYDIAQGQIRQHEEDNFKEIANGIKGAIEASDRNFKAEMGKLDSATSRLENITRELTGQGSFLYMRVIGGIEEYPKGVMFATTFPKLVGKYPLHDVVVHIHGVPVPGVTTSGIGQPIFYGTVYPNELGRSREAPYLMWPSDYKGTAEFFIDISTSNGGSTEFVWFKKVNGEWKRAVRAFGEHGRKLGRPYTYKDEGFGEYPR